MLNLCSKEASFNSRAGWLFFLELVVHSASAGLVLFATTLKQHIGNWHDLQYNRTQLN